MDRVERLCALLEEEAQVCDELAGVLRAEQEALMGLQPEAILHCLEGRGVLQDRLIDLAAQRRTVVRQLAAAHGGDTELATDVLRMLPIDSQPVVRERVRRVRRHLLEARSLERQNAILAQANFDNVSDLLRVLRALVPGARYGANAELSVPDAPDRLNARA